MKNSFLLYFCLGLFMSAKAQTIDFSMGFQIPFASGSIISTQYNYLTDDPVSYHFAKIKNKTQFHNEFSAALLLNLEYTYKMFGLKVSLSPISTISRSFTVYFPHLEDGELMYTAAVEQEGYQIQPLLKYSFKTIKNFRLSLLAGGFYFSQYNGKPYESERYNKSEASVTGDIYKYLLYDDTDKLYGYSVGVEHSFLSNKRNLIKQTLLISPALNEFGFDGFNQIFIQYQIDFFNVRLLTSAKKHQKYLAL
ncbi:MAG: hypothetical protein R3279_01450 [Putridiphycobacter sp.]|nr:hypothetical protein [Putridiphycobacter sp.]